MLNYLCGRTENICVMHNVAFSPHVLQVGHGISSWSTLIHIHRHTHMACGGWCNHLCSSSIVLDYHLLITLQGKWKVDDDFSRGCTAAIVFSKTHVIMPYIDFDLKR